jgi:4-aminobutyrate aminotransferase-like enzyme
MAVGRRIVEKLVQENYLGPEGKIAVLEQLAQEGLARLQTDMPGAIRAFNGIGAMWAVEPADASHEGVKALLQACYRNGLILYYAGVGDGPYRIRMFFPGGVLTEGELNEGLDILRFSLARLNG